MAEPVLADPVAEPVLADPAAIADSAVRTHWRPGGPVDLHRTLGPIRHGAGDPAVHFAADGTVWWATRTPRGTGTLALRPAPGGVTASAWGTGAEWLIDRVPVLLGASDDWGGLDLSAYPGLAEVAHRHPGVRLPSTGRVVEAAVAAAIEQRVTGQEARRSWRGLLNRFGSQAPGPMASLRVPPDAATLLDITTWDWHRLGVEAARQRPIRAIATVGERLEQSNADNLLTRLQSLPGIGPWTAAETAQRAVGHPDAVSVGDYHTHDVVVFALTGRPRGDDAEMLELLSPWAGQRQRVVRLIELSGVAKPRFGPRYAGIDFRGR
jgi:hypothetical protein